MPKNDNLCIRMDSAEKALLATAASAVGLRITVYAREQLLAPLTQKNAPSEPGNDNAPDDPHFARDDRPFGELDETEKSHERVARDQPSAWRQ